MGDTLDDAIESGAVTVSEVSPAGSVSEINLKNHGTFPVFMLDGEELIGAKQNRILNLSVLAPPVQTIVIPVSCVEQGRWDSQFSSFGSSNRAHYSKGRAAKGRPSPVTSSAGFKVLVRDLTLMPRMP